MADDLTGTWVTRIANGPESKMVLSVNSSTGEVTGTYSFGFLQRGQGEVGSVKGLFHSPKTDLRGLPLNGDPRYQWHGAGELESPDRLKLSTFRSGTWDLPGVVWTRSE